MRVLVACEFSGIVRDAFRARGHDAWSCDLIPSEGSNEFHLQGDIHMCLPSDDGEWRPWYRSYGTWDLMIAHPPCTYLCNSGVRWLHEEKGRWGKLYEGVELFRDLLQADIPRICIENPVPHKYAVEMIGETYTQTIQPWQFGHGETKRTCLWLRNLPPLVPTNIVEGREARVHKMSPGPDRGKERSRFYTGIADAMADQWGSLE